MVELPAFQSGSSPGLTTADTQPLSLHTHVRIRGHTSYFIFMLSMHLYMLMSVDHASFPRKLSNCYEYFVSGKSSPLEKQKWR